MKLAMRRAGLVLAALGLAAATAGRATADIITYTESFTATGTLDGQSFTNATVTLTGVGDTTAITTATTNGNTIVTNDVIASVTVGTTTDRLFGYFSPQIAVYDTLSSPGGPAVFGFEDLSPYTIVSSSAPAFKTYNLAGPLDSVTGSVLFYNSFQSPYPTSGGTFVLDAVTGNDVIVTATTAAVPEPSSLVLGGVGAIGLLAYARRRRTLSAD